MRMRRRLLVVSSGLAVLIGVAAGLLGGCAFDGHHRAKAGASRAYPPTPQTPRAIALGNLRDGRRPTQNEIDLARFLFGAEPAPSLTIARPTGLAAGSEGVFICDAALDAILLWRPDIAAFEQACRAPGFEHPFSMGLLPSDERIICDRRGAWRCNADGAPIRAYQLADKPFRPTGVLKVDDEVWISNSARHCIEVFAFATGRHLRSIGGPGSGPGQFALPRDMARTPNGDVCIIDMLNNRVQVLNSHGEWVRDIGQAGDRTGSFGRPKGVAVGPDGIVFVTDAFSQRVHAFAPDGRPLLAFGGPNSGAGALQLPNGVAILLATKPLATEHDLPAGVEPAYYVLVAEQLERPGVRAYAWLGEHPEDLKENVPLPSGLALDWQPHFPQSTALNPHWHPDRCDTCHAATGGQLQPISADQTDALCLSCHDGVQAPADPHPIGRPAVTENIVTPEAYPTISGNIGCITCHDIKRHCSRDARRPAVNYVLLRGYNPQQPLTYCTTCHQPVGGQRFSPHRQRDETGRVRDDACLFCHTQRPDVPSDGRRHFEPHLRTESSDLCLNCHSPHWDLSPKGHVDRPVTPKIRQWMLMREIGRTSGAARGEIARQAQQRERPPARLPLGNGMVTCYTCHNPHYAGLFPDDSELGALAQNPADRASALREDWIMLCSECHHH